MQNISSYEQILMKFSGRVGHGPGNNRLDLGGDLPQFFTHNALSKGQQ